MENKIKKNSFSDNLMIFFWTIAISIFLFFPLLYLFTLLPTSQDTFGVTAIFLYPLFFVILISLSIFLGGTVHKKFGRKSNDEAINNTIN